MRGKRPRSVWLASLRALRASRINARSPKPPRAHQPLPDSPKPSGRVQNTLSDTLARQDPQPVDMRALRDALASAGLRNPTLVAQALKKGQDQ